MKTLTTLILALALTLIPARSVFAWTEVCMEFPLWDSGYEGFFTVTHLRVNPSPAFGRSSLIAVSERVSDRVFPGENAACVDISGIPPGDKFAVSLSPQFNRHITALCVINENGTGRDFSSPYVDRPAERPRAEQAIVFRAGGTEESPTCSFSRFAPPTL